MTWIEPQIDIRARLDAETVERAYAELAASVTSPKYDPRIIESDIKQADSAVRSCLHYIGVEPGKVPESIDDAHERIDWLCRPSGTMRREIRLEGTWYKQAFGAMLGRFDTGEQVALLPRGITGYCYLEPVTGRKVRVTREVAAHIQPDAMLFYKPLPPRELSVRNLVAFIFSVFNRNDYLLVLAAALAATLIGLLPAWANNVAFGIVAPSGQARLVLPIAALLLGVAISTALINATRNLVMARVSVKLDVVSEAATLARLLSLPPSFFKEYSAGNLASRVANMTMLSQQIASVLLGSGLTAVLSIVYIIQIGFYTPALALPAFAIILAEAALTVAVTVMTVRFERESIDASAKLSGTVTALLNGIQKIKLAGAEGRAFAKWAHGYADYARVTYNRPTIIRALPALVTLIGLLGSVGLYYLAATSRVTVADYMAFNVAYGQATAALMAFAGMASQVAQIRPMLNMVAPILETTPEIAADKPSVTSLDGAIEVSDVSFRYSEGAPYVLQNLSFNVKPGEYVALVGPSGSGKSTVMRLLLGFEKPERGTILYGPHDVQKIDLRSLRQHIGTVMQDGKLFTGHILSNITVSTPSATLDDAWEAAELAGIADDIRKMPMGMQTLVTEGGGGMSGGQRQRLMIARAICGKRRILMFDEATSALDNVTQRHVSDSLDALNCTRVVIAHRLSTVRHCDRILVLDKGRIVEEGTYEGLLAKGGTFAELAERQRI